MEPVVNRALLVPRRYRNRPQALAGLGDLIDEYGAAVLGAGDAYSWLWNAKDEIASTNSARLADQWKRLIITGEELRARGAQIQTEPSITGFIQNLFGASSNIPIIGTIDRALSSDLAVYTADAQKFIADAEQLKLAVDQYKRLVSSGVNPAEASATIDQAQAGFFDKLTGAIKWPAIGIGAVLLVGALIIFAPEIKAGFKVLLPKDKK